LKKARCIVFSVYFIRITAKFLNRQIEAYLWLHPFYIELALLLDDLEDEDTAGARDFFSGSTPQTPEPSPNQRLDRDSGRIFFKKFISL